jgi:hypothetical protein
MRPSLRTTKILSIKVAGGWAYVFAVYDLFRSAGTRVDLSDTIDAYSAITLETT